MRARRRTAITAQTTKPGCAALARAPHRARRSPRARARRTRPRAALARGRRRARQRRRSTPRSPAGRAQRPGAPRHAATPPQPSSRMSASLRARAEASGAPSAAADRDAGTERDRLGAPRRRGRRPSRAGRAGARARAPRDALARARRAGDHGPRPCQLRRRRGSEQARLARRAPHSGAQPGGWVACDRPGVAPLVVDDPPCRVQLSRSRTPPPPARTLQEAVGGARHRAGRAEAVQDSSRAHWRDERDSTDVGRENTAPRSKLAFAAHRTREEILW